MQQVSVLNSLQHRSPERKRESWLLKLLAKIKIDYLKHKPQGLFQP